VDQTAHQRPERRELAAVLTVDDDRGLIMRTRTHHGENTRIVGDRVSLVYVEYFSRRDNVPLDGFHVLLESSRPSWNDDEEDRRLFTLARTWRVGAVPEYVMVWYSPHHGLERIGEWERDAATDDARSFVAGFRVAARISHAGLYDPLREPVKPDSSRYYVEYFDALPETSGGEIAGWYAARAEAHPESRLSLLADRIGSLGPDPRGLAIWTLPSYSRLEPLAREAVADAPVTIVQASLYADIGDEVV
jgi:hypothetical protein